MSTRTNIVVRYGKSKLYLYRHHDGYPAETGADIAEKLQAASNDAARFVEAVLAERYDGTSYDPKPRPIYEITSGLHGDIEWLYVMQFKERGAGVYIRVHNREIGENIDGLELMEAGNSVDDLVKLVNNDRRRMNDRIRQLQKSQPAVYKDTDEYPMLEEASA